MSVQKRKKTDDGPTVVSYSLGARLELFLEDFLFVSTSWSRFTRAALDGDPQKSCMSRTVGTFLSSPSYLSSGSCCLARR